METYQDFISLQEPVYDVQETILNESMLDISILAQDKVLKNKSQREEFLTSKVTVYHKTDGIKLTVMKIQNDGLLTDYIFQYKGNVLYPGEYDYQTPFKIKRDSVGQSQFGLVFNHFNKLGKNSIPVGTELFIEYLMRKPTLSSQYSDTHKMVLIGYSKSSWEVNYARLKTKPSGFKIEKRMSYARELNIDTPLKLFDGILGSERSLESGIEYKGLRDEYNSRKNSFNWDEDELLIKDISDMFLQVDSKYGGKEEGVVLQYNDKIIKYQQQYQLDQDARRLIKAKYQEDTPEKEGDYWTLVTGEQSKIQFNISSKRGSLESKLQELSQVLKNYKPTFCHSKKCETNIKDDIQLNQKNLIVKSMKGNNGQLVLGKFRVLTKDGHVKLIKKALKEYDQVVVCLVSSKETKVTKDLRMKMLQATFGSNPKVHFIEAQTGNLITILNKSPININQVIQGSDRVQNYTVQLQRQLGVSAQELERDSTQISQTEVISKLNDEAFFKRNTPPEIHNLYNELLKTYSPE